MLTRLWRVISVLILVIVIMAFVGGVWMLKITHNTLEYSEHLYIRTDALIRDELRVQFEIHEAGHMER